LGHGFTQPCFCLLARPQSFFPAAFQFSSNQAIVWIAALESPFRQARLVLEALDFLTPRSQNLHAAAIRLDQHACRQIDLRCREDLKEPG
jgi:hypothetical protein